MADALAPADQVMFLICRFEGKNGWLAVGRSASPGEDTDREQNVAKDRESATRLAGGEGDAGREGNPVAIDVSMAAAAAGRRLCCSARVPMMEASDHGGLDDPAVVKVLHRSWLRGVLLQGEVCWAPWS